jgi:hypothetical protein
MHDNNQSSDMYNLYQQDNDEDQDEEIAQDDEITEKFEQSSMVSVPEYGDEYMNIQDRNVAVEP